MTNQIAVTAASGALGSRVARRLGDIGVAPRFTSYQAIAVGELDVVTTAVADLAGHPPMSFTEYLERNPAEVERRRG